MAKHKHPHIHQDHDFHIPFPTAPCNESSPGNCSLPFQPYDKDVDTVGALVYTVVILMVFSSFMLWIVVSLTRRKSSGKHKADKEVFVYLSWVEKQRLAMENMEARKSRLTNVVKVQSRMKAVEDEIRNSKIFQKRRNATFNSLENTYLNGQRRGSVLSSSLTLGSNRRLQRSKRISACSYQEVSQAVEKGLQPSDSTLFPLVSLRTPVVESIDERKGKARRLGILKAATQPEFNMRDLELARALVEADVE